MYFFFNGSAEARSFGSDYTCKGNAGETLTIDHSPTRTQDEYVHATLVEGENVKKLQGIFNSFENPGYKMQDFNGEPVKLNVTVISNQGRCGELCASRVLIFAKLSIGDEVHNFGCKY